MQTLNKLLYQIYFQEVVILRWSFASENLFNNGKMLHGSTLHTSDICEKYLSDDAVTCGTCGL